MLCRVLRQTREARKAAPSEIAKPAHETCLTKLSDGLLLGRGWRPYVISFWMI